MLKNMRVLPPLLTSHCSVFFALQVFCEEASLFYMMKGHTWTKLDQSFNTMMTHLKQYAIYTVSKLITLVWRTLRQYNCVEVTELHAYWDWKKYFESHVAERIEGFATSQHGSGMHEFRARRDSDGVVRLWFRRASQSSSWLTEGPGYQVFKDLHPVGEPPLANPKMT